MSSKNLIQSGILELYVLGLCSEEEASRVEEALLTDEQVRREYEEICEALDHLAAEQHVEPPAALKDKILNALDEPDIPAIPTAQATERTEMESTPSEMPGTAGKTASFQIVRWQRIAAAAVILLIGSATINLQLYQRMLVAEEDAAVLRNNNMFLTDENGIIKSNYEVLEHQYAFLANKDLKTTTLKGTEVYPELEAMVFWDNSKGDVYLITNELSPLPEGEQYQLWALDNGTPKDAGMVPQDFKDGGAYKLKNISSSQAFAITIEKKGGARSPTLEKMVVFGNL